MTALRDRYLKEIGIPVWRVRGVAAVAAPAPAGSALGVAEPAALMSAAPDADVWSERAAGRHAGGGSGSPSTTPILRSIPAEIPP